jgi:hypothetical protein
MNKRDAQLIYNLVEGTIFKVRDCAHKEQFILGSKEIDIIYSQVLILLEEKRLRAEAFLNRSKEE